MTPSPTRHTLLDDRTFVLQLMVRLPRALRLYSSATDNHELAWERMMRVCMSAYTFVCRHKNKYNTELCAAAAATQWKCVMVNNPVARLRSLKYLNLMDGTTMDDFSLSLMVWLYVAWNIMWHRKSINAVTAAVVCLHRLMISHVRWIICFSSHTQNTHTHTQGNHLQSACFFRAHLVFWLFSSHFRLWQQYNWQFHTIKTHLFVFLFM